MRLDDNVVVVLRLSRFTLYMECLDWKRTVEEGRNSCRFPAELQTIAERR